MNLNLPKIGGLVAILGGGMMTMGHAGGPSWLLWVGAGLSTIGGGVVAMTVRQNNQTSEQVGAGPKEQK